MISPMYEIIENWTEISITYLNNSENEPEPRKLGVRKPTFVKKAMKRSHGSLCPLCGVKMSNVSGKGGSTRLANLATWEHLLDLCIGGKNTEGNSAIICSACNAASGIVMQTYLKCEDFPLGSREWKDKFISNNLNIIKLQRYIAWKFNSIWFGNIDIDPLLGKIWKSRRFGNLGENTELSDIKTPILQTSKVLLPDTKIPTYVKIKNKLFSLMRLGRGHKDKEIEVIFHKDVLSKESSTSKNLSNSSLFDWQLEKHANDEILTFLKEQLSKRINHAEYSVISAGQLRRCGKSTIDKFEITWSELFSPFGIPKRIRIDKKMALIYSCLGFSVKQTIDEGTNKYKIALHTDILSEENSSHIHKDKQYLHPEKSFPRIASFNSGRKGTKFPLEPKDMALAILKLSTTVITPGNNLESIIFKLSEVTGIPKSRLKRIVHISLKEYVEKGVLTDDATSSTLKKYFQSIKDSTDPYQYSAILSDTDKKELVTVCMNWGLDSTGTKDDIIALLEADEGDAKNELERKHHLLIEEYYSRVESILMLEELEEEE